MFKNSIIIHELDLLTFLIKTHVKKKIKQILSQIVLVFCCKNFSLKLKHFEVCTNHFIIKSIIKEETFFDEYVIFFLKKYCLFYFSR